MNPIEVSIKCKISSSLKPGFNGINIGKYLFSPLPTEPQDNFKTELLLQFKDNWKESQQGSNPEKEGEIILSWLSVILRQKLKLCSSRLNNIDIPNLKKENISFDSQIDFPEKTNELYSKLKSLPFSKEDNLLERYVRSCELYQEALMLSNTQPHISFFLFVVCIECLSHKDYDFYEYLMNNLKEKNKIENITKKEITEIYENGFIKERGLRNNFIEFVLSYYKIWDSEFTEEEFRKLLSSIYKIRSMFTHKGENIQKYINLVDKSLKSKSIYARIENNEIEIPGLDYFSKIVREVLINFLDNQSVSETDNIPKLALNESLVNLIATKEIKKGDLVTGNSIKHRK